MSGDGTADGTIESVPVRFDGQLLSSCPSAIR